MVDDGDTGEFGITIMVSYAGKQWLIVGMITDDEW